MKQNIIKDFDGIKVKVQFNFCEKCKHFESCYKSNGEFHCGTPTGLSEECFEIGKQIEEEVKKIKKENLMKLSRELSAVLLHFNMGLRHDELPEEIAEAKEHLYKASDIIDNVNLS